MDGTSIVVAVVTGFLAFGGAFGGSLLSRRGAKELDRWRRREETMRMLRWAVESASSANEELSVAGLATLDALIVAELLQPEDRRMVESVTDVVTGTTRVMAYAGYTDEDYSGVVFVERREGDYG